jgi:hypothetical protein
MPFTVPDTDRLGGAPAAPGVLTVGTPRPPKPTAPDLPEGWQIGPDGTARPVKGLPSEFTDPKRNQPKTTYRTLTADEVLSRKLPPGSYQESSEGKVEKIADAGKGGDAEQNAHSLLKAAGVDLEKGVDPVSDLIRGSTSGKLQHMGANAYGAVTGDATSGMENIGKLQSIVADMTLQLTGGSLGNQISNADRDFINQRVGNLADADVPANQRLAAWEQVKARMGNILGVKPSGSSDKDAGGAAGGITPNGGNGGGADPGSDGGSPGPGVNVSTDTQSIISPEKKALGEKIAGLASKGASFKTLMGFAVGADPTLRQDPRFRQWVKDAVDFHGKHPGAKFSVDPSFYTTDKQLSGVDKQAAEFAANPLGLGERGAAFLTGAGNAATAGTLDEIANAGSGRDDAQQVKDILRKDHPLLSFGGEMAGGAGAANLLGKLGVLGSLGTDIAYGSAYGAGESNDNRVVGAAAGGATAYGANKLLNYLGKVGASRAANRAESQADMMPLVNAAQEEGVQISRPIVDPPARNRMSYLETTPGGSRPVQESLDATRSGIESRAEALGGGGAPQEHGMMGQRVQTAMQRDLERQRSAAGDIYERASNLAGDTPVMGREIVEELNRQINSLNRNPNTNRALINYLQQVRSDFVNEAGDLIPKTVSDVRNIRTNLSAEINQRNLTRSNAERIVSRALDHGRRDIARDLLNAGPNGQTAAELFREGDVRWRLAKRDEKQVVEKLIGPANNPIPGKQVMDRALQWLQSGADGATHARRFWEKLNQEEQRDFAATVAARFGRKAADEPFSAAQFLDATRPIPVSSRRLLFGEEGARSIANLRALSAAYRDTTRALNNSRSGMVANWGKFLSGFAKGGAVGTVVGSLAGGVPGGIAGGTALSAGEIALQRLSARALMSPDLSRWLAAAPRITTEQGIRRHIDGLQRIAAADSAIASEVTGLRSALLNAVNDNPVTQPIAASQPDQRDGNE